MAIHQQGHLQHASGQRSLRKQRFEIAAYQVNLFLIHHWATGLTIFLGLLVFGALSVPFLFFFGLDSIARPLFYSLHLVCAQIPSHSFYIFGHQLGFCARNFSIYSSMFLGSLLFVLTKKRLPAIPWWLWILMLLPMAWDGITQMFGWRESTWELRTLTGTLFGLGNVLFVLPMMHKSMDESTLPPLPSSDEAQIYKKPVEQAANPSKG